MPLKCDKCGKTLNIILGESVNFCPNCGNKITAKTSAAEIDNTDAALRYIFLELPPKIIPTR